MFKLIGSIPKNPVVACSGGVDSMAVLDFVRNHGKNQPTLAFFNHGTETSRLAEEFLKNYCARENLHLQVGQLVGERGKRESPEEFWRKKRYEFFATLNAEAIITCHHLDDCVESWIFSSLHGESKLIPYQNGNIIRPFLATRKAVLKQWCLTRNVPWVEDASNQEVKYARNRIRHLIVPEALNINPGLHTVIRKKLLELYVK